MKSFKNLAIAVVLCALLAGCAHHYAPEQIDDPYGFFSGLWHGYIIVFSLLGWFFVDGVYVIGQPNTGLFYYIGFIIGFLGFFGSSNR